MEEAYWCKLKLNTSFVGLLVSQRRTDTISNLTIKGQVESLGSDYISFPHLCQSYLAAVQRYLYYNAGDLNDGLRQACFFGKADIAIYLIKKGETEITESVSMAIVRGQTDCVVDILTNHPVKLKVCFDAHNLAIFNYYRGPVGNIETLSKISPLVACCSCQTPLCHVFPTGSRGQQGSVGACGIGFGYRGENVCGQNEKKKLKRTTYVKVHPKFRK